MPKVHDIHLRKLGQAGIITDTPPHELPAQVFSNGINARFRDGYIQRIGGYLDIMAGAPEEILGIVYFKNMWVWAGQSKIYVYQSGIGHTIIHTDANAVGFDEVWGFTEFNGILIASHPGTDPTYWNGVTISSTAFNVLPDWGTPHTWRAHKIRAFKDQLFAIGMTENGVEFKQRVRFSDITQPNVPPAEWITSTTNSAGFIDLSGATDDLVDGQKLGNAFIVYTKNESYQFNYTGGNEVYSVRDLFNDAGSQMENCVATFNNNHLVVTRDDVYVHDGSSKKSIIDGKIKDKFFEQVQAKEFEGTGAYKPRIEALTYKAVNEIWLFFTDAPLPNENRTYYRRVAIWNYNTGAWTYATVPNLSCAAIGGLPLEDVLRWDNADTFFDGQPDVQWDQLSDEVKWGVAGKDFEEKILVGGSLTGHVALDQGASAATTNIPFVIERAQIDLDEEMPGSSFRTLKTVTSIYPQFEGNGQVEIRLGYSLLPTETPTWGTPVVFDMATDVKADFRLTGRYFSIRISSLDDQDWKLSGLIWQVGIFGHER